MIPWKQRMRSGRRGVTAGSPCHNGVPAFGPGVCSNTSRNGERDGATRPAPLPAHDARRGAACLDLREEAPDRALDDGALVLSRRTDLRDAALHLDRVVRRDLLEDDRDHAVRLEVAESLLSRRLGYVDRHAVLPRERDADRHRTRRPQRGVARPDGDRVVSREDSGQAFESGFHGERLSQRLGTS